MSSATDIHPADTASDTWNPSRTRRALGSSAELSRMGKMDDGYSWVSLASNTGPSEASAVASFEPSTGTQVSDQVSQLRLKLEEKEFALLDAQSDNVKALAKLRGLLDLRDKTIRDLKAETSQLKQELLKSQNRSMASAMDVEAELVRSKEQVTILRMRLEDAKDRNTELASNNTTAMLSSRVKELEGENTSLLQELGAIKETLHRKSLNLAVKEAELAEVRSSISEQHGKIRALHEQLASFISQDATDTAKLEILQQDLSQTKSELDVRVQQLQKVVKALNNLKERDGATTAALETQTSLVAELQEQLSHAHMECRRWKQSVDMLQLQHTDLTNTVASLTDQVEDLKAESSARNDVVTMATRSADSVRVLNAALDAAKSEIDELKDQLASARLESRRDCINLQRIADDRQSVIQALQADLNAATTALSTTGFVQPASKRWADQDVSKSEFLDMSAQSGRSVARRRGLAVGTTGGRPIFATKGDAASHIEGDVADTSRSRLINESLSRRIVVLEERIHHLEAEQDSLLDTNEKLRATVRSAAADNGAGATALACDELGSQKAYLQLFHGLVDSDAVIEHCERLIAQVRRLSASCQAALHGKEVPSFSEWEAATHCFPRVPFEARFSHAVMYITQCLVDTGQPRSTLPCMVDAAATRDIISSEIGIIAELKADINERIAASLGEACVTQ